LCGKAIGKYLSNGNRTIKETRRGMVEEAIELLTRPLKRSVGPSPFDVRRQVQELNWNKVGVARQEPQLSEAIGEIESLADEVAALKVTGSPFYNMMYNTALDLRSMIDASRMIAASAQVREETRGAHFRQDFPKQRDDYGLFNVFLRRGADGKPALEKKPVVFKYKSLADCQNYRKP
jgi:succinate dehydrogenase / fumarate reductase flavoprotein subunit/fumarate reductase flavoprotein subunit